MIGLIKKVDELLANVEKYLLIFFTAVLVIILTAQVILRYIFSRPIFWAEEISVQLLVFITLIGMSLLLKKKQMIAIDMLVSALPEAVNQWLSVFLQFLGLMVIIFFAYEGTLWIQRPQVHMELSATTGLPVWINYSMLPITFYAMSIHMAVGLIKMIVNPLERKSSPC